MMMSDNTAAPQNLLSEVGDLLPDTDAAAAVLDRAKETPLGGIADQFTNVPAESAPAEGAPPGLTPFPASTESGPQPTAPAGVAPAEFVEQAEAPTPAWAAAVVNGAGGRPDVSGLGTVAPAFPELNLEAPAAPVAGLTGSAAAGIAGFASPQPGRTSAPTAHVPDLSNRPMPALHEAAAEQVAPVESPQYVAQSAPMPAAIPQPPPTAYAAPSAPSFPTPETGPAFPPAAPTEGLPPFDSPNLGYPDPALDASFGAPPTPTVGQVPGAPPTADAALAAPHAQDLSSLGMQTGPIGYSGADNLAVGMDESVPASVAYSSLDGPDAELRHTEDLGQRPGLSRILKFAALAVGALILGLLALRLLGILGGGDDKTIDPADEQGAASQTTAVTNTSVADPTASTTATTAIATGPVAGPNYLTEQFVDPNGRFQVGLPAQPESSQQPRTLGDTELQADIFTATGLDGHEIHVIDYPADIDPSSYSLDALVADLVERFKTIGINTSVESTTMVDGYPARQIEFKNDDAIWLGFVTSKDQTSYLAMTKTTPENRAVHQQMVESWVFTN